MRSNANANAAGRLGAPPSPGVAVLTTALLALPALVSAAWPGLAGVLAYDRAQVAAGEGWRLVTCHWTHWTPDHLAWDLLAFLVLLPLCLMASRARTLVTLGLSALLIPLAVHAALPELARYRGLSGLDSALFVLLAALLWRRNRAAPTRGWLPGLALAAFGIKVAWELHGGGAAFVQAVDFVPVPLAHVVGGACGALGALLPGRTRLSRLPGPRVPVS